MSNRHEHKSRILLLHPPFDAFISYASEDRRTAIQLQRNLERFRVPRKLVGTIGQYGPIVRRLGRVFVDRTDLSAAPVLTDVIVAALARSKALIVLCSRAAADPRRWVDREITSYRQVRPDGRIFAVIARDEPPACFPSELLRPNDIADFGPISHSPPTCARKATDPEKPS